MFTFVLFSGLDLLLKVKNLCQQYDKSIYMSLRRGVVAQERLPERVSKPSCCHPWRNHRHTWA